MSSSFPGVSVYLLEWFLSVVEPEATTLASLDNGLLGYKTSPGWLQNCNLMLGNCLGCNQGCNPEDRWPLKKTHRHCVRLNDVSFEGLMIHSTTSANGHGCLFFVAFRFQFGGVWYDNHGISEETTRKAQNSRSVGFFGLPLRLRGALLSRKLFGRRRGEWDFPTLNRKLMIFRNHKMTVDSLNLLFSDLLVGREFSSKLEVEDVWFFKGWHPRWTVIHKSRIQMPRMGFADLSGAGKYWRLLVETANSLFSLSHHTHIQDSKVLEDEMKRTGWHL